MSHAPTPHGTVPGDPRASAAPGHEAHAPHSMDPRQVIATRELFWQNVIREILTSLSMICALRPSPPEPPALSEEMYADPEAQGDEEDEEEADAGADASEGSSGDHKVVALSAPGIAAGPVASPHDSGSFDAQLFDGRLAVMTRRGERIPIADVFPLFACGIDTPRDRVLSLALECTVFQIRTPAGEVYTLPLHEMTTFHALSPELMRRLSQMARQRQEQETGQKGVQQPFGFAAFTSISRETPPPMTEDAEPG
jgi:hypothetical protein